MENGQKPRFADCTFALLAIFLILVVGMYCLPLVLPDRVLKVCIMRRPRIAGVKRYCAPTQFQKPCASFLQNLDSFFDRFHLYYNLLLSWLVVVSFLDAVMGTLVLFKFGGFFIMTSMFTAAIQLDRRCRLSTDVAVCPATKNVLEIPLSFAMDISHL
jgi:hypothetical protein